MVVLNNTIAADNGAGPLQHVVNGKDTGGLRPQPGLLRYSWHVCTNAAV